MTDYLLWNVCDLYRYASVFDMFMLAGVWGCVLIPFVFDVAVQGFVLMHWKVWFYSARIGAGVVKFSWVCSCKDMVLVLVRPWYWYLWGHGIGTCELVFITEHGCLLNLWVGLSQNIHWCMWYLWLGLCLSCGTCELVWVYHAVLVSWFEFIMRYLWVALCLSQNTGACCTCEVVCVCCRTLAGGCSTGMVETFPPHGGIPLFENRQIRKFLFWNPPSPPPPPPQKNVPFR